MQELLARIDARIEAYRQWNNTHGMAMFFNPDDKRSGDLNQILAAELEWVKGQIAEVLADERS